MKTHNNMKSKYSPIKLAITSSIILALQPVAAQELERITVKSQYKEEDLQSVPIAITALSEADIERRNMTDALSINDAVPNINIAKNFGAASGMKVFLRGIGEDESRLGADPAIGVYVDGVYVGRQTGALLDLADIESIEVLRGPQGTLYGRNSNGGAIRVTTKQPLLEDETTIKLSAGSDRLTDGYININKALTDKLAAQVSVMSKSRDGFMRNTDNDELLGDVDKNGAKVALKYFGDVWEITWSADFMRDNSEPGYPTKPELNNGDSFTLNQAMFPLTPLINGETEIGDFYNSTYQRGTMLKTSRSLDNGLEFNSLTSYRELDNELLGIIIQSFYQNLQQDQFSQEFRLSNDTEDYSWVSGVYFFREDATQDTEFFFGSNTTDLLTNSAGLFGQYTYNISDDLHLTGGARYTWEKKEFNGQTSPDYWNSAGRENQGLQEESWGHLSWKAVIAYDINPDVMTYASITTGFKSGGWSTDSFESVDEETVTTYEIGVKSDLSKALRLNVNAFYNDYIDLQVNGTTDVGVTRINAGDVKTYGIEANLMWQITEDIVLDSFIGTLEGEYSKINDNAASFINEDSELKQAPPLSYGMNLTYFKSLGDGQLTTNLQYAYTDKQYNDLANTEIIARQETNIINARVSYTWGTDVEYKAALWAKNALDEEYSAAGTTGNSAIYPGVPRTIGIDFSVNF